MKKHAYLITAFDNLYVLDKCVHLLDHEANVLFIHCDSKFKEANEWICRIPKEMEYSKIIFTERKDVKWGSYTYTDVILTLLSTALSENYDYYHLITGTSLPIKSQKEIHEYFDGLTEKRLFFHINQDNVKAIQERCQAYYPLVNTKYFRKHKLLKAISVLGGKLQISLGVNRLKNNPISPLYNGWGWFSIPHDFAEYACSKKDLIEKTFKLTLAADEVWIQSVAAHSPFSNRLNFSKQYPDAQLNSKHFQDWERGRPYTFTIEDYDLLMKDNPCFFARKFSDDKKEIVDAIFDELTSKQ